MSGSVREPTVTSPELPVGLSVIEAIADAKGVDAEELDPVYEHVDLDAIETLVASGDETLRIRWSMHGHRIEVDGTGTVHVV